MGARRRGQRRRKVRRAAAAAVVDTRQPAAGADAAHASDGGSRHGRLARQRPLHRRPHQGALLAASILACICQAEHKIGALLCAGTSVVLVFRVVNALHMTWQGSFELWSCTYWLACSATSAAAKQPGNPTSFVRRSPMRLGPRAQVKGQSGEKELLVRVLDVPSLTWSVLQPSSAAPPARGGHSVRRVSTHET